MPEALISFEDWKRYILPVLQEQSIPSIIFFKDRRKEFGIVELRTFLNGFDIKSSVEWSGIIEYYAEKETQVSLEGPPPEISGEEVFNKFNQDFMDSRGICDCS